MLHSLFAFCSDCKIDCAGHQREVASILTNAGFNPPLSSPTQYIYTEEYNFHYMTKAEFRSMDVEQLSLEDLFCFCNTSYYN